MKSINEDISESIWRDKYRDGNEVNIPDSRSRVCRGVYIKDVGYGENAVLTHQSQAYLAMVDNLWCPGGRIHAGAGTNKRVTLINCYVNKTVPDSMVGIMDALNVAALTQQQGGGIGTDFSTVRPAGAVVTSSGSVSTGVLPFMDMFHSMCSTVKSSGSRRGAMMGTLACWHPDIIDFVKAKREKGRLTNFNVSVLVTDAFMKAVQDDAVWELGFNVPEDGNGWNIGAHRPHNPTNSAYWRRLTGQQEPSIWFIYKALKARELWDMIIRNTYDYAEPGVIFIDRINSENSLDYCEFIHCTNPCFVGDTKVWTDRGNIPFRDLVGKTVNVLTRSDNGLLGYRKMSNIRKTKENATIIRITWIDGSCTYPTPEHEFYALDGIDWKDLRKIRAIDLKPWDRITTPAGYTSVSSIERLNGEEDVYCGSVEETGRFFIFTGTNGILCKNCGEQPFPPNGDCSLGAVNLAKMVSNPFEENVSFDYQSLTDTTTIGMRFLDNVLDVSLFPTEEQRAEAMAKRRTGIGIMGLANALQMLRIRYGSKEACEMTRAIMRTQRDAAYMESVNLAKERGAFPLFDKDKYLARPYIKRLPEEIRQGIAEYGIRNGVIQTIAPTGTTSIYYENVSSGIEPTFMWKHFRKVLQPDNSFGEFEVLDYGYKKYVEHFNGDWGTGGKAPNYMVIALELSVGEHLAMQAAAQEYVDSSISKTISCPKDISFETFSDVYTKAYAVGLKGVTTYRPSDVRGAVLSMESQAISDSDPVMPGPIGNKETLAPVPAMPYKLVARPKKLMGTTYKIKWPKIEEAFYVTINDLEDGAGTRRPFEIFINSKSVQHGEWITAMTRCVSAIFRRGMEGGDITFIVDELIQVHSAAGGSFMNGGYVPSIVALIGQTIEEHLIGLGMIEKISNMMEIFPQGSSDGARVPLEMLGDICPKCNQPTMFRQEGCAKCSCGYSSC